jgi:hypothetical protein
VRVKLPYYIRVRDKGKYGWQKYLSELEANRAAEKTPVERKAQALGLVCDDVTGEVNPNRTPIKVAVESYLNERRFGRPRSIAAYENFSQFEFADARGMTRFSRFVERYFGPEFHAPMYLQEPTGAGHPPATTAAEHLYKYFRSGLAHSFCIEWGGLQHREEGAPAYLFEAVQGHGGERALGVAPRELAADFRRAIDSYFRALEGRGPAEAEAAQFNRRFEEVYLNKERPPLP